MKLAVWMDPLERLKPQKDTTLLMIERAQRLGWSCVYFTTPDIFFEQGVVCAQVSSIDVRDVTQKEGIRCSMLGVRVLSDFDIILIRQDPPFNAQYMYGTYLVEWAERTGVIVSNKPASLRDVNEKMFTMHFAPCCPPTLVSSDPVRLKQFWRQHQHVVFKPLDAMGGHGVCEVRADGRNVAVIIDLLTQGGEKSIMAQRYIPEISTQGDKRILMLHGEPAPYALARIPSKDDWRGNLAAGASGQVVPLTEQDYWLCSQIAPTLRSMGLHCVGVDVIGEYITEINVTSPTCMREISEETGLDLAGDYLKGLSYL